MNEVTITATDISQQPFRNDDTEISVLVMRTCTFLVIRKNGRPAGHYDISRADWEKITRIPAPDDGEPGSAPVPIRTDQDSAANPGLAGRRRAYTDSEIPEDALDRALGSRHDQEN